MEPHPSSAISRARAARDTALATHEALRRRLSAPPSPRGASSGASGRRRATTAAAPPRDRRAGNAEYVRGLREMAIAVGAAAAAFCVLRAGLVRYRVESDIPGRLIRRRATLHGYVMRVTDGDGLRFYHQPWLRRALFPEVRKMRKISGDTINVRLAAVDAPECAHFGGKAQPFGKEAKEFLRRLAEKKQASLEIHQFDQYNRVLGTVRVKSENPLLRILGLGKKNVSMELATTGLAEVYRGSNACYGRPGKKAFEAAEKAARRKRIGMWSQKRVVTPTEFKAQMRQAANKGNADAPQNLQGQSMLPLVQLAALVRGAWKFARAQSVSTPKRRKGQKQIKNRGWF